MRKIVVVIGAVFFGLCGTELLVRKVFPQKTWRHVQGTEATCYLPHEDVYVWFRPSVRCRYSYPAQEYDTWTHTDELGFRIRASNKKKEGKKILFLGDSYTFGQGVSAEEAFPFLVETMLSQQGVPIQSVNGGIPGVGVDWYAAALKVFSPLVHPDMTFVMVYLGNDLLDYQSFYWKSEDAFGMPSKIGSTMEYVDTDGARRLLKTPYQYQIPFFRNIHLTHVIAQWFSTEDSIPKDISINGSPCLLDPKCHLLDTEIEKTIVLLSGMKQYAEKNKSRFLVLLAPWEVQLSRRIKDLSHFGVLVTDDERRYHLSTVLGKRLEENGIMSIDLLPAFDRYVGNTQVFYPIDKHWTPQGHNIVAEEIVSNIMDHMK